MWISYLGFVRIRVITFSWKRAIHPDVAVVIVVVADVVVQYVVVAADIVVVIAVADVVVVDQNQN